MGSTMVQLITECTQELGIPTPTTVAGAAVARAAVTATTVATTPVAAAAAG